MATRGLGFDETVSAPPSGEVAPADGGTIASVSPGVSAQPRSSPPVVAEPVSGDGATARAAPTRVGGADPDRLRPVDPANYARGAIVASGGMGRIVEARDLRLGRRVALKEMRAASDDLRRRFEREARITARLQHPGIITVHEAGVWPNGEPFFAMKLVAGKPLDAVIADCKRFDDRIARLPAVLAVADALAYAHRERVIHRDLKPANVLVGDFGETVVIDWGLAKDLAAVDDRADDPLAAAPYRALPRAGETVVGAILGTPAYMPPEQARGEPVDERADVYALGAILYFVLCGQPALRGTTIEEVLAQALEPEPPAPRALEPRIPIELATIIGKAMARERSDRYPSAVELADDLRQFTTGQLVASHHYTRWQLVRRWAARRKAPLAVLAACTVAIAVLGVISFDRVRDERDVAQTAMTDMQISQRKLLVEDGRHQWLYGAPNRALAYLLAAARAGADGFDLRYLLARAGAYATMRERVYATDAVAMATTVDERRVVTVNTAGIVRTWDAASGAKLDERATARAAKYDVGANEHVVVSRDPYDRATVWIDGSKRDTLPLVKQVVYADDGGLVWLLGPFLAVVHDGQVTKIPNDHTGALAARAVGADLVWGTSDAIVRARLVDGVLSVVATTKVPDSATTSPTVAISRDLQRVLVGEPARYRVFVDGVAIVDETTSGGVARYALSNDGQQLINTTFPSIEIDRIDRAVPAHLIAANELPNIETFDFSGDDQRLVVTDGDRHALVIDVEHQRPFASLSIEAGLQRVWLSKDGSHLFALLRDGSSELWTTEGSAALPSASGQDLLVATFDDRDALIVVGDGGASRDGVLVAGSAADTRAQTLSANGRYAVVSVDSGYELYDLSRPSAPPTLWTLPRDEGAETVAVANDGTLAVISNAGAKYRLSLARDGKPIGAATALTYARALHMESSTVQPTGALAFSPDALHLLVIDPGSGSLTVFDARTAQPGATGDDAIYGVWSGSDTVVFVGHQQLAIALDVNTGRTIATAPLTGTPSANGAIAAIGGSDGYVTIWDRSNPPTRFSLASGSIAALAVSPSGEMIAAAYHDGEYGQKLAGVWTLATGHRLDILSAGAGTSSTVDVGFSADSKRLFIRTGRLVTEHATDIDSRPLDQLEAAFADQLRWSVHDGELIAHEPATR